MAFYSRSPMVNHRCIGLVVTRPRLRAVIVALILGGAASGWAGAAAIPFPSDYREWAHVKSVLIGPGHAAFATDGGLHHIYANRPALEGYRAGRFADGSVIVYDLLEVKEAGGATFEGAQRRVDVMVKDSRRYPATGGWGFARFGPDRHEIPLTTEAQAACAACHAKRRDRDFVFSEFRQ